MELPAHPLTARSELKLLRPKAAIVDMDGTLVDVSSVRHYVRRPNRDFDAFHQASRHCPPNQQALDFCWRHHLAGDTIVVVTARMDRHWSVSHGWLEDYHAQGLMTPYDGPFMRPDGLRYSDVVIKRMLLRYIRRHYDVVAACDDNPSIVELWTDEGIPEIEVVPGWED